MEKKIYHILPVLQTATWAGDKLIKYYDLKTDLERVGQVYHVIALPGHLDCTVEETGQPLSAFYRENPDLFDCPHKEFPIRMATTCSAGKMSYQLHPNDEYALEHEGCRGKVAGMVSLEEDGEPDVLPFGNTAKTLDEFKEMVDSRDWDRLFGRVTLVNGDFLHTPPGVIHGREGDGRIKVCCGTGGDVTYRFFDFDRNDPKRPLNLERVCACVNIPEVPLETKHVEPVRKDGMLQYDYHTAPNEYTFKRFKVDGEAEFRLDEFMFLACVDGEGSVSDVPISRGQTLFVPVGFGPVRFSGRMDLFLISCPD